MSQPSNKQAPVSGAASRAAAAKVLFRVLEHGESLSTAFPEETRQLEGHDKRLAQAISYGVLRVLPTLNQLVAKKLAKPLKGKYKILNSLLLVGAYQLYRLRTKDHAAVSATVEAAKLLGRKTHTGLINGVLRQLLREAPERDDNEQRPLPDDSNINHPRWFVDALVKDYPADWQQILTENNEHPPMWLRVNTSKQSTGDYLARLEAEGLIAHADNEVDSAIRLDTPTSVDNLPGFADGDVSVQDRSAQMAGFLLDCSNEHRVLDCCAAPGGKTLHLLQRYQFSHPITAIDIDAERLERVKENLSRQSQPATLICADIATTDSWWDGHCFDRILLDAPCSATGVIRRHPDIKWLRRASDIDQLAALQAAILDSIWPLLAKGGELLYATCSVLKQENDQQIQRFLARQQDATLLPISEHSDTLQLLPSRTSGDGFYYAKLKKQV